MKKTILMVAMMMTAGAAWAGDFDLGSPISILAGLKEQGKTQALKIEPRELTDKEIQDAVEGFFTKPGEPTEKWQCVGKKETMSRQEMQEWIKGRQVSCRRVVAAADDTEPCVITFCGKDGCEDRQMRCAKRHRPSSKEEQDQMIKDFVKEWKKAQGK